jgi:methyl-accepting chemotaxis protein
MGVTMIRMRFLTNIPLQGRFLTLIIISMVAPLILVGGCLYYLIFNLMAEQLGIPESIAYNLLPVLKRINIILLLGVPPILLLLLLWGIFLSHKFVGPIIRLKNEIDKMAQDKDLTKRLRVRKSDTVKPLIDSINKLLEKAEKG